MTSRLDYSQPIQLVDPAGGAKGPIFLESRPRLRLRTAAGMRRVVASASDNWSRLSWRTLGNGAFWWTIADIAGVADPFAEILPRKGVRFRTELAASVTAGEVTTIQVKRPHRLKAGMRVLLEDVATGESAEAMVAGVLPSGVVNLSSATTLPNLPAETSRVLQVYEENARFLAPGTRDGLFRLLDTTDPFNTLEV